MSTTNPAALLAEAEVLANLAGANEPYIHPLTANRIRESAALLAVAAGLIERQQAQITELEAALAEPAQPATTWTCAARAQGTAGGNAPADCGWPTCGCDPAADKVIAALQESGVIAEPALPAAGWRPMSEAPDQDVLLGRWTSEGPEFSCGNGAQQWKRDGSWGYTHWLPLDALPPLPSEEGGNGR